MITLDKPVYLTEKGRTELEAELAYLQDNKRLETIARLQEARGGGDWMDNTEHMLIEEELAFIDARIQEISYMLDHAQLIEPGNEDNQVDVGETVIIQTDDGGMEEYTIVGVAEADPGRGFISNESPLGHALLRHKVGDEVIVKAPIGELHYRIVALS
ncbi:MAG: transcription elongation factor GreA [Chloroflexi bacterium]|nr:transcription elongation factor GreA [Ardenticatenaceae bacterium]MBL1128930.1 transcription elongation factor GreA [Chloroflexota bacterium]NOG35009.1 transcription elongation factor GreA [Chloroflexota bacterium]GIK58118.1 MAG: transcription elongation factor GreA [Chloroflexota bacterium]